MDELVCFLPMLPGHASPDVVSLPGSRSDRGLWRDTVCAISFNGGCHATRIDFAAVRPEQFHGLHG